MLTTNYIPAALHFLASGLLAFLLLDAVPAWAQTSAQADTIDGGTVLEGRDAIRIVKILEGDVVVVPITIYWITISETATADDYWET